ncbi:MAG: hypothetical protein JWP89_2058 [Schlesneria sp.]|nr:hypothetical protein [Schlesneria sp.]
MRSLATSRVGIDQCTCSPNHIAASFGSGRCQNVNLSRTREDSPDDAIT